MTDTLVMETFKSIAVANDHRDDYLKRIVLDAYITGLAVASKVLDAKDEKAVSDIADLILEKVIRRP